MKKNYSKSYEELEKNHWWWQVRRKIVFNELEELLFKTKNNKKKLLDIGCGPGINLQYLKDVYDVKGIEPDQHLLKLAKKNSSKKILKGYLPNKLPKFNHNYDIILLLDVLEHIQKDRQALMTVNKLLKNNGYLVINVPAMQWLWSVHDEINQHKRRYKIQSLENLLKLSGFEIVKIRYWGFLLAPIVWLERKILKTQSINEYEVAIPSKFVNTFFKTYTALEYFVTSKFNLPFGLSVLAVVRKSKAL